MTSSSSSKKKVLAICGSTKKGSSNEAVLRFIERHFHQQLQMDLYLSIDTLPHFNPDLVQNTLPDRVLDLQKRIQEADGIIFCTPEYVFSLPGSLKNAIEWNVATTVFSNKPTALIVAATSGEMAFKSLLHIMTTLEARIHPEATLLIKGVKGKVSAGGNIHHEETAQSVVAVVEALLRSINEPVNNHT